KEVRIMPGGDRTGPVGAGPMTGRGAGYCNGFNRPGSFRPGAGMGRGRRNMNFSAGRPGFRYSEESYSGDLDKDREIAELKNQLQNIESKLDQLTSE
ncbi:MAG: DUF5320 domain-containing protein, partial [Bacillota bacterium]